MSLLDRYLRGEFEQVWSELLALGPAVHVGPERAAALAVARETMLRVRRNCERLIDRLHQLDYEFGIYPDGSSVPYQPGPLRALQDESLVAQAELEREAGPVPISLSTFWGEVGAIDLMGRRSGWPGLLDPLVVYPPEAILSDLDSWQVDAKGEFHRPSGLEGGLSPDYLHKDNISGGPPYAVALPNAAVDFILLNERHELHFVPYLRMAILQWDGFPGLDRARTRFEALDDLRRDLEPF